MLEESNPYSAPKSDIGLVEASPSRRIGWKAYAYGMAVIQIVGFFLDLKKIYPEEILDDLVTTIGMIGLFGYAYRRPFWRRKIWMLWAVLFPVSNVVVGVWGGAGHNGPYARIGNFGAMLFLSPQYLAVIRYAYRSRELWRRHSGRDAG
jgi:hypothetical protein